MQAGLDLLAHSCILTGFEELCQCRDQKCGTIIVIKSWEGDVDIWSMVEDVSETQSNNKKKSYMASTSISHVTTCSTVFWPPFCCQKSPDMLRDALHLTPKDVL
ncbi:hypothetical protein GOODEAATRI_019502 [Goodea atripinnis]|uniref:Uncharacterized protein n=1 Tax=Goodea atripinnis TaxID=208336 RepID=A0ABV0PFB4_9TELE